MSVEYSMSITFSVIFFLKTGFHAGISLVAGEIVVSENKKTNRAPNLII